MGKIDHMQKIDSKPANKPLNIKVVNMLKKRLLIFADTIPY